MNSLGSINASHGAAGPSASPASSSATTIRRSTSPGLHPPQSMPRVSPDQARAPAAGAPPIRQLRDAVVEKYARRPGWRGVLDVHRDNLYAEPERVHVRAERALRRAVKDGNEHDVSYLLDEHVNPGGFSPSGKTALQLAAMQGNASMVRLLLRS